MIWPFCLNGKTPRNLLAAGEFERPFFGLGASVLVFGSRGIRLVIFNTPSWLHYTVRGRTRRATNRLWEWRSVYGAVGLGHLLVLLHRGMALVIAMPREGELLLPLVARRIQSSSSEANDRTTTPAIRNVTIMTNTYALRPAANHTFTRRGAPPALSVTVQAKCQLARHIHPR